MNNVFHELRDSIRSKLKYMKRFGYTPRYDTSDVIQETCLRIHQDFDEDSADSLPEELLKKIVFAQLANQHRFHRAKKRAVQNEIRIDFEHQSKSSTPEEKAQSNEMTFLVLKAMEKLSKEQKSVVTSRLIQEKTFVEIGENLGQSVKVVRRIYENALSEIKRTVGN